MFKKILIANRGEIALRIQRACREMGIQSVVVYSEADRDAKYVKLADEAVCIGPAPSAQSYLHMPAIISAAEVTDAEAIHPGYGFLSENAQFARMVEEHGFTFIGPKPEHIDLMGDKVSAKQTAQKLGLPVIPGSPGAVEDEVSGKKMAEEMGFPVLLKAASGGGGRGMKVVTKAEEFVEQYRTARSEAKANFGDDSVYMEKYLKNPRHIEIQVFGDKHGNAVHLGERDCSLQRRHQKVLEEGPSPVLTEKQRDEIGSISAEMVRKLGYVGAGTIEYLYEDGKFYFMEMNTRIQVEHPVTEAITGYDLIAEQIQVAAGLPLSMDKERVRFRGHAIEIRINAENPETFAPSPGEIKRFHPPGGLGIRFDSAIYQGYKIPPYYDSMVGKLIVHARDREQCIRRLNRAIHETVIEGIETTLPLHAWITEHPDFLAGDYSIRWLEDRLKERAEG